jgi:hypothetical protein
MPRGGNRPRFRTRKKSGIVRASTGTVWATGNVIDKVVRKRKRNRVTAVAARKAISAEKTTTLPATTSLSTKYRPNSCCPKARRKAPRDLALANDEHPEPSCAAP